MLPQKKWKAKDKMVKATDVLLKDGRLNDIIIPVMGPTGVGKSTFINTAIGTEVTMVGHDLKSCTAQIQHATCPCPGDPSRRIVLVDTPGFDDTYEDDSEILRRIAVWLASSYDDQMKLSGVIYLNDITQSRVFGTSRKNLDMFRRLCGENAEKKIVMVTSKWSKVIPNVGERREGEFRSSFWKEMIEHGSKVARFTETRRSAWDILELILANKTILTAVRIQEELVELGRILPETDAGNALRAALKEMAQAHKRAVDGMKGKVTGAEQQQRLKETERELRELLKQIQVLKVPFGARLKAFFGLS